MMTSAFFMIASYPAGCSKAAWKIAPGDFSCHDQDLNGNLYYQVIRSIFRLRINQDVCGKADS